MFCFLRSVDIDLDFLTVLGSEYHHIFSMINEGVHEAYIRGNAPVVSHVMMVCFEGREVKKKGSGGGIYKYWWKCEDSPVD